MTRRFYEGYSLEAYYLPTGTGDFRARGYIMKGRREIHDVTTPHGHEWTSKAEAERAALDLCEKWIDAQPKDG